MGKRISKQEEEKILAAYTIEGTYKSTARKVKRSATSVEKIIKKNAIKIEKMLKTELSKVVTAEDILRDKFEDLSKLSDDSFELMKKMIKDPLQYNLRAGDAVKIYKVSGDTMYQMNALIIKQQELALKKEQWEYQKAGLLVNKYSIDSEEQYKFNVVLPEIINDDDGGNNDT